MENIILNNSLVELNLAEKESIDGGNEFTEFCVSAIGGTLGFIAGAYLKAGKMQASNAASGFHVIF